MKTLLSLFTFGILTFTIAHAQTVCPVKFPAGADVKVYVVTDSTTADLVVYQTQDTTAVGANNGVWYFGAVTGSTPKKVYFDDNLTDADFNVYFTSNAANAGWINTSKSGLMN